MALTEPLVVSVGEDGLPVADDASRQAAGASAVVTICQTAAIGHSVSFAVALAIYKLGDTASYDRAAAVAFNSSGSGAGAYVFFSAVVWSVLTWWLNLYPMIAKSRVMLIMWPSRPGPPFKLKHKDLRVNPYIYRVSSAGSPCAVFDEAGDAGMYNRANRSLHHWTEWAAGALFTSVCAVHVFPFPVFVVTVVIAAARVYHQQGYSKGGHGAHAPGFFVSWLSIMVLEKLCLIAGCRQLMLS